MSRFHSQEAIDDLVYDILRSSKAFDVFPTPVDKIVDYCELNLTNNAEFHRIPSNYVPKKLDAFKRMLSKVLGAFDREEKVIFIDPSLPPIKKTFVKLHETGHAVIPWQKDITYQDDDYTLSNDVKELFETEANYFASGSLFQLGRFEDEMNKLPLEIRSPMVLATKFGGSKHAAIRRYAEVNKKRCALIILEDRDRNQTREFSLTFRNRIQSKSFTKEFGIISLPEKLNMGFPFVMDYINGKRFHTEGSIYLTTKAGMEEFTYHYFNNSYNVFVLIIPIGEKIRSRTTISFASPDRHRP